MKVNLFVFLLVLGSLVLGSALAQDSYLSANGSQREVTDQPRLLHYLSGDMPVQVYIATPQDLGTEALRGSVQAAFLAWQQAAPDTVQFDFVNSPGEDVLEVRFDPAQTGVGTYRYSYAVLPDGQWRFQATSITLNPTWEAATLYRYALVQVGHALGLLGRSPFEGDAMSTTPSGVVTDRDAQTLNELYAIPSGTVLVD